MTKNGLHIKYGNIAPEAKENFVPTANETKFDTLEQLQKYNLTFLNYANPCEKYQTVLDGSFMSLPAIPKTANLGLWSEQVSNEDGTFTNPVVLELKSQGKYSSDGLTFTFDTQNNIYATRLKITWMRVLSSDETIILDEKEYTPDNAFYTCNNTVTLYNKIVITFYALNMPNNRLKLRSIDYGYGTVFYANELRNVKINQSIDPISSQININTVDFTFDNTSNNQYVFQSKQPINVYFNGQLKATSFVKKATRKSQKVWDIKSEDYIGLLDSITYYGGMYFNAKAFEILENIFEVAKVPYNIDEKLKDIEVSGHIPYTTCRDALMQVVFAIQAVVDTSNSTVVKVYALDDDAKKELPYIPLSRIMQGQNFNDEDIVTGVELTAHEYKAIENEISVYDASKSGVGDNIFVKFNEPLHSLSITNGEIVSQGANYAIIKANDGCVLKGKKYEHTLSIARKINEMITASVIDNVVKIEQATLISSGNVDNVLKKCYNWLTRTTTINLKIVEGKHVQYDGSNSIVSYDEPTYVGEKIKTQTQYLGELEGRIIKQTFNLNGGIIIKETVVK